MFDQLRFGKGAAAPNRFALCRPRRLQLSSDRAPRCELSLTGCGFGPTTTRPGGQEQESAPTAANGQSQSDPRPTHEKEGQCCHSMDKLAPFHVPIVHAGLNRAPDSLPTLISISRRLAVEPLSQIRGSELRDIGVHAKLRRPIRQSDRRPSRLSEWHDWVAKGAQSRPTGTTSRRRRQKADSSGKRAHDEEARESDAVTDGGTNGSPTTKSAALHERAQLPWLVAPGVRSQAPTICPIGLRVEWSEAAWRDKKADAR